MNKCMRSVSVLSWKIDQIWQHYLLDSNRRAGRETVCVVLSRSMTPNLVLQRTCFRQETVSRNILIGFHFGLKCTTVHVTPDTHWSTLSLASHHSPAKLTGLSLGMW